MLERLGWAGLFIPPSNLYYVQSTSDQNKCLLREVLVIIVEVAWKTTYDHVYLYPNILRHVQDITTYTTTPPFTQNVNQESPKQQKTNETNKMHLSASRILASLFLLTNTALACTKKGGSSHPFPTFLRIKNEHLHHQTHAKKALALVVLHQDSQKGVTVAKMRIAETMHQKRIHGHVAKCQEQARARTRRAIISSMRRGMMFTLGRVNIFSGRKVMW